MTGYKNEYSEIRVSDQVVSKVRNRAHVQHTHLSLISVLLIAPSGDTLKGPSDWLLKAAAIILVLPENREFLC